MTIAAVIETISTDTTVSSPISHDTIARTAWATIAEPGDPHVGALIARYGAEAALNALLNLNGDTAASQDGTLAQLRASVLPRYSVGRVVDTIRLTVAGGYELLTPSHPNWPASVANLGETGPFALWVRGDAALLSAPSVALTGTQFATPYGRHVCVDLASGLIERGWAIASGAARGIDAAVLSTGRAFAGRNVVVLPMGMDDTCPAENVELVDGVATRGVVVSEIPPGQMSSAWRFQRGNRLLAALTTKTIIVEAEHESGHLHTAETAIALGRPCGAVPGRTSTVSNAGCDRLIRQFGAQLVATIDDADRL
ncbi:MULTISPECIES: DNA-processing protein DprA [unclassified Cryobacterium]|uniref:DNA-processing protein DprA n=1 Tax=unclassified Cryobacterium TaxID=2649013 RepID=UPI000CE513B4|nr:MULTISPECIES: DNA-processing protein DprA [unclassified Cryobacterium]TFD56462.1 DNA-protecting protein DprA [Cryobacterium sp. Hh38]